MKSLKINLEDNCDKEKLIELLILIKGIKSIEIISENEESTDLRKIIDNSKEQLKSGDYESFVNNLFDTFTNKKF